MFWRPATAFDPAELVTEQGFRDQPGWHPGTGLCQPPPGRGLQCGAPDLPHGLRRLPDPDGAELLQFGCRMDAGGRRVGGRRTPRWGRVRRGWHQAAGTKHKQNVFDDFIAAAEWLIEPSTLRPQLAIRAARTAACWSAPR